VKEDGRWKEGSEERGGKREVRCISEETALEGREVRPFLGWLLKVRFGSAGLAETKTRDRRKGASFPPRGRARKRGRFVPFFSIRKTEKVQLKSFSAFYYYFGWVRERDLRKRRGREGPSCEGGWKMSVRSRALWVCRRREKSKARVREVGIAGARAALRTLGRPNGVM